MRGNPSILTRVGHTSHRSTSRYSIERTSYGIAGEVMVYDRKSRRGVMSLRTISRYLSRATGERMVSRSWYGSRQSAASFGRRVFSRRIVDETVELINPRVLRVLPWRFRLF